MWQISLTYIYLVGNDENSIKGRLIVWVTKTKLFFKTLTLLSTIYNLANNKWKFSK